MGIFKSRQHRSSEKDPKPSKTSFFGTRAQPRTGEPYKKGEPFKNGFFNDSEPFFKPQAKLKVGESNDKFEQEADHVANQVVNNTKGDSVQKKSGEEEIQQKPIASQITPYSGQTSSNVSQKKGLIEDKPVQKMPEEEAVQKAPEEEPVQMAQEEEAVQKKDAVEEEPVQKAEEEEPVQKKEADVQRQETGTGSDQEEPVQMAQEEPVQAKREEEAVQKKDAVEEEPVQKAEEEEPVQMKEDEEPVQAKEEEEVQKKAASGSSQSTSIESRLNSSKGGGKKLSGKAKNEMESGFGADFSNVNVHTDQNAIQMSEELGAKAFAHGNDVYFNKGQYNPESSEGKHLLAHELTHTIQQGGMVQKKVQRHMQSSYPWDGIVSGPWGAAVREVPKKEKWIADIPKGTRLTVIGNSGNWLKVRVMTGGIQRTGYMSQELVSLAKTNVVAEMGSMVGDKAAWVPSGPSRIAGTANSFVTWAEAKTEVDAPKVQSVTTINCWEMVLLAAYKSGAITWKFIHDLYLNNKGSWYKELPNRLTKGGQTLYSVATMKPVLKRGQLVFFDGANHVALATGKSDQVLTFWPPPNITKYLPGTIDEVKVSSISALNKYMKKYMNTPKVTIGDPIW